MCEILPNSKTQKICNQIIIQMQSAGHTSILGG